MSIHNQRFTIGESALPMDTFTTNEVLAAALTIILWVAVMTGVAWIIVQRTRARRTPVSVHPTPLNAAERDALRQWHRKMRINFIGALGVGLPLILGLRFLGPDVPWVWWSTLLLTVAILAQCVRVQFSHACPRCGYKLGLQTQFATITACERCGVALK